MEAEERRAKILKILQERPRPISGGRLAQELGVSRQVIVQDIALLRAGGSDIFATPQGYLVPSRGRNSRQVFACQHAPEDIEEELRIIIEEGGKVLDVIVEHPLYGDLRGLLMLCTISDLKEYLHKYRKVGAEPLSALTRGVHLHTVEAEDQDHLHKIEAVLKRKGFLLQI